MLLFDAADLLLELLSTHESKLEPEIHPYLFPTII